MESDVYDGKRVVLWKGDKLRVDVPLHSFALPRKFLTPAALTARFVLIMLSVCLNCLHFFEKIRVRLHKLLLRFQYLTPYLKQFY